MRVMALVATVAVALTVACTAQPSTPQSPLAPATVPAPINVTGRWTGSFRVESCAFTGDWYTSCASDLRPGVEHPVNLDLTQTGLSVSGLAMYGELYENEVALGWWFHPVSLAVAPGEPLRFSSGWGQPPFAVTKLEWDLAADGSNRLRGTLKATRSFYRRPGVQTGTGSVVVSRAPRTT